MDKDELLVRIDERMKIYATHGGDTASFADLNEILEIMMELFGDDDKPDFLKGKMP